MLIIIYLIIGINTQSILDGVHLIHHSFMSKIDYNPNLARKCHNQFELYCNLRKEYLTDREEYLKNFIISKGQGMIELIDKKKQHRQEYMIKLLHYLNDILIYEDQEQYLKFLIDFTIQQYHDKEQEMQQYFVLNYKERTFEARKQWPPKQVKKEDIFVTFTDFIIPKYNTTNLKYLKSSPYPPDIYTVLTKSQVGKIEFSQPVYVSLFYLRVSEDSNLIFELDKEVVTSKWLQKLNGDWYLVRGPLSQVDTIIVPEYSEIDSLMITTDKTALTEDQMELQIQDMLIATQKFINTDQAIKQKEEKKEKKQDRKKDPLIIEDELDLEAIQKLIQILKTILDLIDQRKQQTNIQELSSQQIQQLIDKVQQEYNATENFLFSSLFNHFKDSNYSENEIQTMYEIALTLQQISQLELEDNN